VIRHVAGARHPPSGLYDADVVILALDRLDETVDAVRSALAQTGVSRHVTILDQGSMAENLAWLEATVAGRTDATLLRSDRNLGVAEGRNQASACGHGRVIVGMDNDAEFATTGTLAGMVAALDAEPDLAAIGCRIANFDTGQDDLTSWGYPRSLLPQSQATFLSTTFVGAGHAIRRSAWDAARGYDPALFFCWEEYDFCLRAIALGWRVRYRGDLTIRHKIGGEHRVRWSGARWFQFVRNRLYVGRKYGTGWLPLAPRIGGYLLKGLRIGQPVRTVRAIVAAVGMAHRTAETRLPPAAVAYLQAHDAAHRKAWFRRLRTEVLSGPRDPVPTGVFRS
jgi:GT2 family glycosyltransferase